MLYYLMFCMGGGDGVSSFGGMAQKLPGGPPGAAFVDPDVHRFRKYVCFARAKTLVLDITV